MNEHPIGLIVDDDLRRNRLTVLFRLFLAIPQAIVVGVWSIVVWFTVVIAWIAALVTGRVPHGLHVFHTRFLRAGTHVYAYVLLLAEPWPPFFGERAYPIDVRVDPAADQSRLSVLFRIVLAIPALLLSYVFRLVNQLVALLGWFYALATGRMHEGMRDVSAWMLRYEIQTYAYLLLLTARYPSLAGAPTA